MTDDSATGHLNDPLPSGIEHVPYLTWGSHVGQVYASADDLRDTLVPYFKAGLENHERCLWVTGAPFGAHEARSALRGAVSDLETREACGQIEIRDAHEWYAAGEKLKPREIVTGLLETETRALRDGYRGLRTNGNCDWVDVAQWDDFQAYETLVPRPAHALHVQLRPCYPRPPRPERGCRPPRSAAEAPRPAIP